MSEQDEASNKASTPLQKW